MAYNYFEDADDEEGIECFHIGDIVSDEANDNNGGDDASSTATPAAADHHTQNKKKWIIVGASVIATSLAVATGVLISKQRRTQKTAAVSLSTREEIPWYACLDRDACFRQARLLGFSYEDLRTDNYTNATLYGCFRKNGPVNDRVYWGEGGTEEQMVEVELPGVQERIWCYDVNVDICAEPTEIPSKSPAREGTSFPTSTSSFPRPTFDGTMFPTKPSTDRPSMSASQPSSIPSISSRPSFRPSISSQPSPVPSISLRPSISSEPSASPSISSQPSTSSQPSDMPSTSSSPSISSQPSSSPSR